MSSRRNFIDADNSIMERNLRFVKNDLEENLNQYFGGSNARGSNSTKVSAPPRDYKVVQPKPGGSHAPTQSHGLEARRDFLLKVGLTRHVAYEFAKKNIFEIDRHLKKRQQLLDRGVPRNEIYEIILHDIRLENEGTINRESEPPLKAPPAPLISKSHQDEHLKHDREERNIFQYNRSRSRSPSRRDVPYHNDERFNPIRSRSPPRGYNVHGRKTEDFYSRSHQPRDVREMTHSPTPPRGDHTVIYERNKEEFYNRSLEPRDLVTRDNVREISHSHPLSIPRRYSREDRYQDPRSHSPRRPLNTMLNEDLNEDYYRNKYRDEVGRDIIRHRSRSYSPRGNGRRLEHLHSSRSRSPNGGFGIYCVEKNDFRGERIREHSYSPSQIERREENYPIGRTRSPNRDFDKFRSERYRSISPLITQHRDEQYLSTSPPRDYGRNPEDFFSRHGRSPSRPFSPPRHESPDIFHRSLRSRSPTTVLNLVEERNDKFFSQTARRETNFMDFGPSTSSVTRFQNQGSTSSATRFQNQGLKGNMKFGNNAKGANNYRNKPQTQIPSLLTMDVFANQNLGPESQSSQNKKIPSLFDLQVYPDEQPSTSAKVNQLNKISNKKFANQKTSTFVKGNRSKPDFKGNSQQVNQKPSKGKFPPQNRIEYRPYFAKINVIKSGLKKPPPGHLKADPKDYWSKWWPQYKYIHYSLPIINPSDIEVQTCMNFMFRPNTNEFNIRKNCLLRKAVKAIMKTVKINENNYYVRDIYKLMQYKRHLEDPNFQNYLTPEELNIIAPALRQFQIKPTMALLHQAMICRWHISLDIMRKVAAGEKIFSNYARLILNEKCFHYLTWLSIQELKKMCEQDWPEFPEFFKTIKSKKVDIYALGVGPDITLKNDNYVYKHEDDNEDYSSY